MVDLVLTVYSTAWMGGARWVIRIRWLRALLNVGLKRFPSAVDERVGSSYLGEILGKDGVCSAGMCTLYDIIYPRRRGLILS